MPKPITEPEIFDIAMNTAHEAPMLRLLEQASRVIGEINNFASDAVQYGFIVQALKNTEALASARIEGTTASLRDLYLENTLAEERKVQLKLYSAINYRLAMNDIDGIIQSYKKIDLRLIRHLHKILTENDPATKGVPGMLRDKDVKILNSKLGDFWPAPVLRVREYMDRLIAEVDGRSGLPTLIRSAISHYQFESIHPFEDGNGRTGRMLIVAEMLLDGSLRTPVLNLSEHFDDNREEYVTLLRSVTDTHSYGPWVRFFLNGVIRQGEKTLQLIKQLQKVESASVLKLNQNVHSPVAAHILRFSLDKLYITIPGAADYLQRINLKSNDFRQIARINVQRMVELGILEEVGVKAGRMKLYAHKELRELLLDSR